MKSVRLTNRHGAYIEVMDFGATLLSVVVPDRRGAMENVVLRYPQLRSYYADRCCVGSTIGRFANRIAGAQFRLGGQTYHLDKNEGECCCHGGFWGFAKRLFDIAVGNGSVTFAARSPHGEGGFPGNVELRVTYAFNDDCTLRIAYRFTADRPTVASITNHAYFNLHPAHAKLNALDHRLQLNAEQRLVMDKQFVPTGKLVPTAGTAYDFAATRLIREAMAAKREPIRGYNAYFTASGATLASDASGRTMKMRFSTPGILLYTGDFLRPPFAPFAGIALEAQLPPDAPNHAHFPSCLVEPNKPWTHEIVCQFSIDN